MTRETIDLRELFGDKLYQIIPYERVKGFKQADSYTESIDLEKGYSKEVVIYEREDGKFFKCEYENIHCSRNEINPIMEEVFPKEIVKIIYE